MPGHPWRHGTLGVQPWHATAGTITGNGGPRAGTFNVADPGINGHARSVQLQVRPWSEPAPVVTGKMFADGGPHAVAEPDNDGQAIPSVAASLVADLFGHSDEKVERDL